MAIQDYFDSEFYIQDWISKSDGLGGFVWDWIDGIEFKAGLVKDSSTEARIAEAQQNIELYTIITDPSIKLEFGDIIRRKSDNVYFRITSNYLDTEPPQIAQTQILKVSAQKWEKPL